MLMRLLFELKMTMYTSEITACFLRLLYKSSCLYGKLGAFCRENLCFFFIFSASPHLLQHIYFFHSSVMLVFLSRLIIEEIGTLAPENGGKVGTLYDRNEDIVH